MKSRFRKTAVSSAVLLALAGAPLTHAAVGDAVGSPISVGAVGGDNLAVATGAEGNFVVAWLDGEWKVLARCFNADGTPASDAVTIPSVMPFNNYPAVAADAAGNSVVTWQENDSGVYTAYAQRLDSSCALQGEPSDLGVYDGLRIPVAMAADGRYVVVFNQSGTAFAQRYAADGTALGSAITVASGKPVTDVASRVDGGFVVVLEGNSFYLRYYDADGNPETGLVSYSTSGSPTHQRVAVDGDGDVVVGWGAAYDYHVYAQRFDASGNAVGGRLEASDAAADQSAGYYKENPAVAMDDDGDFWLAWHGYENLEGAIAQRFDSADTKSPVSTVDTGGTFWSQVDVAMDVDGDAVVVYIKNGNLYAQRFEGAGQTVDLGVTGVADPATINVGNDVTYTWTVSNNGSGTALAISLDDALPPGLSYRSFNDSLGDGWACSDSSGTVTCTLPRLVSAGSSSVDLVLDTSSLSGSSVDNSATGSTPMSDTDSSNDSDTVTLAINNPPGFDATPVVSGTAALGNTLSVSTPGATDPEGDGYSVSYQWQADGVDISGATGDGYTITSAEAHTAMSVVLTLTDIAGAFATTTVSGGTVANTPAGFDATPTISGSAEVGNTLTVADTATTDADGDSVTLSYQWQADGAAIDGATGDSYTLTSAEVHAVITVEVSADDGYDTTSVTSDPVTVANRLPSFDATPTISGTAVTGNTLSVTDTGTSDADGDSVTLGYQWQADGVDIAGATTASYTLTSVAAHSDITVVVTADDGYDTTAVTTAAVTVDNTAPVISGVDISGSANPGETVTAVVSGTDSDGDTLVYSYAWYVDGVLAGTGESYIIGSGDIGKSLFVIVTVSDGHGGSDSSSSMALSITGNHPVFDATPIITGTAVVGSILSASGVSASDADDDAITYSYQWRSNGAAIAGATASSYTLTSAEAHSTITLQVTADDSGGGSAATISEGVTVQNSSPVFGATPSLSGTPSAGETIAISGLTVNDVEGDAISYSYLWFADGTLVGTDSSYTIGADDAGKSLTVAIYASDGYGGLATTVASGMTVDGDNADSSSVDGSASSSSGSGGGGAVTWLNLLPGLLLLRRRFRVCGRR